MTRWIEVATHQAWLPRHTESLLAFGTAAPQAGLGAAWLASDGSPCLQQPVETWITCRMVHVYSLGHLLGIPGCRPLAQRAMSGLTGQLRDQQHGGWFHTSQADGGKQGYDHAFVILAASSATVANLPGAAELLDEALTVMENHFWDEDAGKIVDVVTADFSSVDPYRGINANMHSVEAFLAAADATGDRKWLSRAQGIASFALSQAASNNWRLPEHYDADWQPLLGYNAEAKDDKFRPYGATAGHGLEWARLFLHLEAALGSDDPDWLNGARQLYARAVADAWAVDGTDGFVYTNDWDGAPVTRDRLHWVVAEAIGAAAALAQRTGEQQYHDDYKRWWDHAAEYFIDEVHGSWHHQLSPANVVTETVWPGKPDLYHAVQGTLIPRLPLAPSLASALAQGQLH